MARRIHSVMSSKFSSVPVANIRRSVFDRSFGHKTTFQAGRLVPLMVDEVLPGDTFSVDVSFLARLTTPIHPIMDNMNMTLHAFFVPNRLVWNEWENFIGNNNDSQAGAIGNTLTVPTISLNAKEGTFFNAYSLFDYMGIPPLNGALWNSANQSNTQIFVDINALPVLAYGLIWSEYYRDENLFAPIDLQETLSMSSTGNFQWYSTEGTVLNPSYQGLHPRCKRHDYFTSALPWPQKGPSCVLPLADTAPVVGLPGPSNVHADTSKLGGTINQLREALQIQNLLEIDARGGTRYIELILSHFGVSSPDARLQRPEYLGGIRIPVNITPIAQTSATENVGGTPTTPQGNLAAVGTCSHNGKLFTKSFVEHGYIIVIGSVDADLNYQQGLERMWSRQTRYDFYWPSLAHLGEQPILNKEIYLQGYTLSASGEKVPLGTSGKTDDDVFGYQERYAEYRYKPSMITGAFRSAPYGSNYTSSGGNSLGNNASLDVWHLAQAFSELPQLSQGFMEVRVPLDRVLAISTEQAPPFLFDSYFRVKTIRPMPTYAIPGVGGRL